MLSSPPIDTEVPLKGSCEYPSTSVDLWKHQLTTIQHVFVATGESYEYREKNHVHRNVGCIDRYCQPSQLGSEGISSTVAAARVL